MIETLLGIIKALLEAFPNVLAFLKETVTGWFKHPHFRNRFTAVVGRYSLILALVGGLWYTINVNLKMAETNGILNEKISVLLKEKMTLEGTCAIEAPKQQEYAALERRLAVAHDTIRSQKEMLELCTTNQADAVNRRLRELGGGS